MARKYPLREITLAYWEVASSYRIPTAPALTVKQALDKINSRQLLRPEDWRLHQLMHTIQYDIIEGDSTWREEKQMAGSISILPIRN